MTKLKASTKTILSITFILLSIFSIISIANATPPAYMGSPVSYEILRGDDISGDIHSVEVKDDGDDLEVKWARKNEWWKDPQKYYYRMEIRFFMRYFQYQQIQINLWDNIDGFHRAFGPYPSMRVKVFYTDGTSFTELVDGYGQFPITFYHTVDVDTSKQIKWVDIYLRHRIDKDEGYDHYGYIDYVYGVLL